MPQIRNAIPGTLLHLDSQLTTWKTTSHRAKQRAYHLYHAKWDSIAPLPQPHDLIKCFVTERVLKRQPGVTRGGGGAAGPTIILSGRVLLNHHHRLHFWTGHLRIQINEVPLDSNSHCGPEEAIKRPCDLLPKAAFSQLGSGVGSGRLLARTRGQVAWSCRVARRVPHSFPVPERHCASGPAPLTRGQPAPFGQPSPSPELTVTCLHPAAQ